MRHKVKGRKLSRNTDQRKRLIRGLTRELILRGQVRTTMAKAKAIRGAVEKLITKAKRGTNADLNIVRGAVADKQAEEVLLSQAKTRFTARTSGYTRIVKLGVRRGDATEEVLLSFVDPQPEAPVVKTEAPKAKKEKTPAKKTVAKKTRSASTGQAATKKK